jgi:hypothetical protein
MDDRTVIDLSVRQVDALRSLQAKAVAAQAEVTAYMSAILHGYDVPPNASWALSQDGSKFIRQA